MLLKNRLLLISLIWAPVALPFPAFAESIPFRIDQPKREYGGLMYVSVLIGEKVNLLRVATGAATSRIHRRDWNKDIKIVDQTRALNTNGVNDYCDLVEVPKFSLLSNTPLKVAKSNYLVSRCDAMDSDELLGINFFYGNQVLIDFDREALEINPRTRSIAAGWSTFRVIQSGSYPLLALPIDFGPNRHQLYGLFDSGTEVTAVDLRFVQKHPELFEFVSDPNEDASAGEEGLWTPKVFRLRLLKISETLVLRDIEVIVYDFSYMREVLGHDTPFILGFNALNHFNWHLNLSDIDRPTWRAEHRKGK